MKPYNAIMLEGHVDFFVKKKEKGKKQGRRKERKESREGKLGGVENKKILDKFYSIYIFINV